MKNYYSFCNFYFFFLVENYCCFYVELLYASLILSNCCHILQRVSKTRMDNFSPEKNHYQFLKGELVDLPSVFSCYSISHITLDMSG